MHTLCAPVLHCPHVMQVVVAEHPECDCSLPEASRLFDVFLEKPVSRTALADLLAVFVRHVG